MNEWVVAAFVGLITFCSFCLADGAQCSVQVTNPSRSVAARLLRVIVDLEEAHATFQRREKEEGTSVIPLNP